jgi:ribose-phosphate pyrophosphokinase
MVYGDVRIISNNSGQQLWRRTIEEYAAKLDEKQGKEVLENCKNTHAKFFPSGEKYVQLQGNSRKKDIHIVAAFHDPIMYYINREIAASNLSIETKGALIENFVHSLEPDFRELEKICDGARRSGANNISVYFAYYPDCRQDKKDEPHVPISAKLTMDNLTSSAEPKLDRIGVVDIHAAQTQGFTNFPVDEIKGRYFFFTHLKHELGSLDDVVLIFPDGNSYTRYQKDIKLFGLKHAIISKSRPEHSQANIEHYIGDSPKGKIAVILDDMIDGGGTTLNAGYETMHLGAKEVRVYCTHFLGSTKVIRNKESKLVEQIVFAEDRFKEAGMKVYSFTTVPRTTEYRKEHSSWLTQFSIAPYIADLIRCNTIGESHGGKIKEYMEVAANGSADEIKKEVERMTIKHQ